LFAHLSTGLQTGTALVTAQLTSTLDVLSAKIRITVRDKVLLNPSGDVWLPLCGSIQYIVEKWRKGRPTGALTSARALLFVGFADVCPKM